MMSNKIKQLYERVVDVVFGIILVFIILGIVIGAAQLFITIWQLLRLEGITGRYIDIIVDVLAVYVMIEFWRSLLEYFSTRKLRLTFVVDAAIVFVICESLIGLFKHEIEPQMLYAFSAFLLVLGALRIDSVLGYLREKWLLEEKPLIESDCRLQKGKYSSMLSISFLRPLRTGNTA